MFPKVAFKTENSGFGLTVPAPVVTTDYEEHLYLQSPRLPVGAVNMAYNWYTKYQWAFERELKEQLSAGALLYWGDDSEGWSTEIEYPIDSENKPFLFLDISRQSFWMQTNFQFSGICIYIEKWIPESYDEITAFSNWVLMLLGDVMRPYLTLGLSIPKITVIMVSKGLL